jgi:hypothetical protein
MKSKHRGGQTHWVIQMRDGYTHHAVGDLHLTPKKSALVWYECEGRRVLVFGAVKRLIKKHRGSGIT